MTIADHAESLRQAERRLQAAQLASDVDALDARLGLAGTVTAVQMSNDR
jgi:hypothetical protein